MNKDGRSDEEEAAAKHGEGVLNQIKGNVKEVIGEVIGVDSLRREGTHDRMKGKVQEEYADLKEKESRIERDLDNLERK